MGLELRPRRLREAAALWRLDRRAAQARPGRDAVWDHPDLLPDTDDLDDPAGYARRSTDAGAASLDLSALERDPDTPGTTPEGEPANEPGDDTDENGDGAGR